MVKLGDLLVERRESIGKPDGGGRTLLGVSNVSGLTPSTRTVKDDLSRYLKVEREWFAYNPMRINVGSVGYAERPELSGIVSPDYVVFSCGENLNPKYLYNFLTSSRGLREINKNTSGSVRERLYFKSLAQIEIPLPDIPTQARLVTHIGQIKSHLGVVQGWYDTALQLEIPHLRQAILELAIRGKLVPQDPKDETRTVRLGDVIELRGGATPPDKTEYWNGRVPWVTPKDMKVEEIHDSQDHITEKATKETSARLLPVGSVLVVVRGMILAHTFPVAVLKSPAAINQDMKALIPTSDLLPDYLCQMLWGLNPHILSLVERSTHGTCKLLTDKLMGLEIPLPSIKQQKRILEDIRHLTGMCDRLSTDLKQSQDDAAKLMEAVVAKVVEGAEKEVGAIDTIESARMISLADRRTTTQPEKQPTANDQFKEAILIAAIVRAVYNDPRYPVGRFRRTKLAYLVHRKAEHDVQAQFLKKAAGPYNPWIKYKGPEKIVVENRYVKTATVGQATGFIPGDKIAEIDKYLPNYGIEDALKWVVATFRYKKSDELELLTTVDFAALDLLERGQEITVENITQVIRDNPEWTAKLKRNLFSERGIQDALEELAGYFPGTYEV